MCNGPCGSCTCTPARRQRLYDGQNITTEEIHLSATRPLQPCAAEIIEVDCPEVSPPPAYNRGINWKPGR